MIRGLVWNPNMMWWLLLKNLLFTVLVPGTVGVYLPLLIAEGPLPVSNWSAVLAFPVFALGAGMYAWCVWDFATFGRGTPLPIDAPGKLVARGLYRYTRNPMYVGVLTMILGCALAYQDGVLAGYALVVASGFHLVVVLYEERGLRRTFGDEYDTYCSQVSRWLPKRRRPAA